MGFGMLGVLAATPAPFINLDFELADTSGAQIKIVDFPNPFSPEPLLFGTGLVSELLPGWTVKLDGGATDIMALGNGFFDTTDPYRVRTHAALLTTGNHLSSIPIGTFFGGSVEGRYALLLDNFRNGPDLGTRSISVSQIGDVPEHARFLTYRLLAPHTVLAINGSSPVPGSWDASDPSRRFIDVSQWAGQTVEIKIGIAGDSHAAIDSLAFVVPEPGTVALFSLGAVSLALAMRRRRG